MALKGSEPDGPGVPNVFPNSTHQSRLPVGHTFFWMRPTLPLCACFRRTRMAAREMDRRTKVKHCLLFEVLACDTSHCRSSLRFNRFSSAESYWSYVQTASSLSKAKTFVPVCTLTSRHRINPEAFRQPVVFRLERDSLKQTIDAISGCAT